MPTPQRNRLLELKFNEDKTQVTATIAPPGPGETDVTASEILERLKGMGVTYGILEQAILDAIHYVANTNMTANAVVAQGTVPKDGKDAIIHYRMPHEVLSKPVPKGMGGHPDWFSLDSANMVKADDELAAIVPAHSGTPGKTLTWPIQAIPPRPGKPAALKAGANIRTSPDGLRLYAQYDGYACLQGERLQVYALRMVGEAVTGGVHNFQNGAVFMAGVQQAQILAGEFVAVKGVARGCQIRAHGDVFLNAAENCVIVATGNIYIGGKLSGCRINTPKRVIGGPSSTLVGGAICATEGIETAVLGAPDFTSTQLFAGIDQFSQVRANEIEEELASCEANIARISQALKPFASLAVHTTLTEDKRALLQKLQAQQRSQEMRIKELHSERRLLTLGTKDKRDSSILATQTAYPGVWVGIGSAALQIEVPMERVQFVEGAGGKTVQTLPLEKAA